MKAVPMSATMTAHALAMKRKAQGERIYNLAAGDPVLPTHQRIIDRAVQEAEKRWCLYPPVEGLPELRRLVAEWMNRQYQTQYAHEQVLVTCGGKFALFSTLHALLQASDEVLIPIPYWSSYPDIVHLVGATCRLIPTGPESGWKLTANALFQGATQRSTVLIFNNACNPTGVMYTKEEVRDILAMAKKMNLLVISDEVYSGLAYEPQKFVSCGAFAEYSDRVVVIQSCSKNFAMTGWRVGFVLAPEPLIKRISVVQGQSITGTPLPSQWAAIGAFEHAETVNSYVREAMRARRDLFTGTFNALFPVPINRACSALYALVPIASMGIRSTRDSSTLCMQLLTSHNVAAVPGVAFGVEGYIRFAFAEREEELYQALHRLREAV